MGKRIDRMLVCSVATLSFLGFAASAAAQIVGQCADCHTMHNSEQGQPVAVMGVGGSYRTTGAEALPNLLRMDCIACHAQNTGERIVTLPGGSKVPQVYHNDPVRDLAAGNFAYISGTKEGIGPASSRKGHNVVDLVEADTELLFPPGYRHTGAPFEMGGFDVQKFTCAGSMGCHGYRGQVLGTIDPDPNCNPEFQECGTSSTVYRTGLAALSGYDGVGTNTSLQRGAHHYNYDGLKDNGLLPATDFYANPLANSYRFIRSLRGYGNEIDRWQNVSPTSHNEYAGGYEHTPIGAINKETDFGTTNTCSRCHVGGSINAVDSRLTTPSSTMTGFCITCHGSFHSSGVTNGASGAFLRHPSDYVIPDAGEYSAYTTYSITAPVARPASFFSQGMSASATVNPGDDLVMCLSCHMAHAAPYDGLLRFDYAALTSGMRAGAGNQTHAGVGCLACHTTKGGPMP